MFLDGEWKSIERDHIKKAVRERRIRLVVATDAACEGLNLQTLGTLINVDLPWNPSRLEQRIGRIKRFGQRRDRVDMLNLVYHGTVDEKVYETLSERMRERFDIFGTLPDVIEDDWIEDIENLDEKLKEFTSARSRPTPSTCVMRPARHPTTSDGSFASGCWLERTSPSACRLGGANGWKRQRRRRLGDRVGAAFRHGR